METRGKFNNAILMHMHHDSLAPSYIQLFVASSFPQATQLKLQI